MMYSQDSFGLGHLRRATNLANELVVQRPDLSILLVVDSPVAPFFDLREHIDFVKLPTVVKVGAGVFKPGQLLTSYSLVKNLRSNVIREVMRRYRPDLVLVDHMPGGANRDLIPALKLIRPLGYPTRMVLGLRDIIDNPAVTRAVWEREGFYDTLKQYYDRVLIYGSSDIFPTADAYGIRDAVAERVQYCGYVCNMEPVKEAAQVRAKLGVGDEPLIAVMAGGGADAYRLMQTYLDALPYVHRELPVSTVMVTGPFMPDAQRRALRDQARALGVLIHTAVGDSLSQINAADLVVSMAGYNTLSEILRFEKPAVVVPRPGPSAEQRMRANILADRGLVTTLDPSTLSPEVMAAGLLRTLTGLGGPRPGARPGLTGVAAVTAALLDLLPGANGHVKPKSGTVKHANGTARSAHSAIEVRAVRHGNGAHGKSNGSRRRWHAVRGNGSAGPPVEARGAGPAAGDTSAQEPARPQLDPGSSGLQPGHKAKKGPPARKRSIVA
jgi:predicted glycosyltransferase